MDIINIFPDGVLIELFNKFEWKKLLYLRLISKNWKIKIESLDLTFPIKKEYIFKIIHKFSIDKFFIINKLNISKEGNIKYIHILENGNILLLFEANLLKIFDINLKLIKNKKILININGNNRDYSLIWGQKYKFIKYDISNEILYLEIDQNENRITHRYHYVDVKFKTKKISYLMDHFPEYSSFIENGIKILTKNNSYFARIMEEKEDNILKELYNCDFATIRSIHPIFNIIILKNSRGIKIYDLFYNKIIFEFIDDFYICIRIFIINEALYFIIQNLENSEMSICSILFF
jgi:hypothetical protein